MFANWSLIFNWDMSVAGRVVAVSIVENSLRCEFGIVLVAWLVVLLVVVDCGGGVLLGVCALGFDAFDATTKQNKKLLSFKFSFRVDSTARPRLFETPNLFERAFRAGIKDQNSCNEPKGAQDSHYWRPGGIRAI
jgi:hypothetical protein